MKKTRVVIAAFGLVSLAALAGCYERTVRAKGLGAEYREQKVYEPNLRMDDDGGGFFGGGLLGPREFEERGQ